MENIKLKSFIKDCLNKNPCEHFISYEEPMKEHTTFKVGGPADCFLRPYGGGFLLFCADLLERAHNNKIPVFILGGGANIVVSDKGIRGIVLDITDWKGQIETSDEHEIIFNSGTPINKACEEALSAGFTGLEFLAGMPGTIGGAVYMNARCYGSEISDILNWTEIISYSERGIKNEKSEVKNENLKTGLIKRIYTNKAGGFGYKQSPFQSMDSLILSASFKVNKGDKNKISYVMEKNKTDRKTKGHFLFPSAGSIFKNNHDFGKPTGAIIDELGLKGLKIGGAQVAPFHGNIIINSENASAADIRSLINKITVIVKEKTGFLLEPEVLFAGDWS